MKLLCYGLFYTVLSKEIRHIKAIKAIIYKNSAWTNDASRLRHTHEGAGEESASQVVSLINVRHDKHTRQLVHRTVIMLVVLAVLVNVLHK